MGEKVAEAKLPKVGNRIPTEKFHVSKLNVRADEAFGETEEDQQLIAQLRHGKVVQPFKARVEADGYGVYVGRRRFLAKKALGAKTFVVGVDCVIEEVKDGEAQEASLVENILRKDINPVARARAFNEVVSRSPTGLRGTARRLGMSPSTLSEYMKILELSPKMQGILAKGLLAYKDGLELARMKVGTQKQDELAELLEKEGWDAFKAELARLGEGKGKRGIPRGTYIILRTTFDRRYKPDIELYEKLSSLAEAKNMEVDEYAKEVLRNHVKTA